MGLSGRAFQVALPRLLREMRKCVLLCHNCHGEVHAGRVGARKLAHAWKTTTRAVDKITATSWRALGLEYV
jgi:hypothetical protein